MTYKFDQFFAFINPNRSGLIASIVRWVYYWRWGLQHLPFTFTPQKRDDPYMGLSFQQLAYQMVVNEILFVVEPGAYLITSCLPPTRHLLTLLNSKFWPEHSSVFSRSSRGQKKELDSDRTDPSSYQERHNHHDGSFSQLISRPRGREDAELYDLGKADWPLGGPADDVERHGSVKLQKLTPELRKTDVQVNVKDSST